MALDICLFCRRIRHFSRQRLLGQTASLRGTVIDSGSRLNIEVKRSSGHVRYLTRYLMWMAPGRKSRRRLRKEEKVLPMVAACQVDHLHQPHDIRFTADVESLPLSNATSHGWIQFSEFSRLLITLQTVDIHVSM